MGTVTYKGSQVTTSIRIYRYDNSAGTFSASYAGVWSFDYFDDTATVGDILYCTPFNSGGYVHDNWQFYIGTPMVGTGITIIPEYWNGSAWTMLVDYTDETNGFTQTGQQSLYFDLIKQTGINRTTINGVNSCWIRFRISALATITEGGANSLQAVTYRPDRIWVSNYTSGTPASSDDMYAADKAGTQDLIIRAGLTATDGSTVNSTYSLRPADYYTLGGAANDLYITVSNYSGFTDATVQVTGTDRADVALTEDIVITANGTYYATKSYKTLTDTQIVAVTGTGSLDYTLTQGQWGVVWSDLEFRKFDRPLALVSSYIVEIKNHWHLSAFIWFCGNGTLAIWNFSGSNYMTFGEVASVPDKSTQNGMVVYFDPPTSGYSSCIPSMAGFNAYGTTFMSTYQTDITNSFRSTDTAQVGNIWNCVFTGRFQCGFVGSSNNTNLVNTFVTRNSTGIRRPDATTEISQAVCHTVNRAVWFQSNPGYVKGLTVFATPDAARVESLNTKNAYLVDVDTESWGVDWSGTNTGNRLYRMYSFDITVTDIRNNLLEGAQVKLTKGTESVSCETNSIGTLVDASWAKFSSTATIGTTSTTVIDSTASFQTDNVQPGQILFNKDDFTFTYVVAVFSETILSTRDAIVVSGDDYFIDNVILEYGNYDPVNDQTLQNDSDWLLEVFKSGYEKHTQLLTLDRTINADIALEKRRYPNR